MRDMENTGQWTERFEMPTWVDYVRMHGRTTHADAPVSDRIRALHRGDGPPRVRRMLIRSAVRSQPEPGLRSPLDIE